MSRFNEIDIPEFAEAFFRKSGPGRLRILILTFQFDPSLFEARFDRLLKRGGIRIDVVMGEQPRQPRRDNYNIWLANWRGTFHPKMMVLMANTRIAVGVGSANITWGGLGGNLESWQFFEDSKADRPLLANVRGFLASLRSRRIVSPHLELLEIIKAFPPVESGILLSTLNGQLMDQVAAVAAPSAKRLDILSPLNCDPGSVLLKMRKAFKIDQVCLYTNMSGTKVPPISGCNHYYDLTPPKHPEEEDKTSRRYAMAHVKMYAFHSTRGVDLFWGSANLSASAWLRKGLKANLDLLVHSRLTAKQWENLRDKLPAGHEWRKKSPAKDGKLPEATLPDEESVRLLNGVWDGRRLFLEASQPGILKLWLRAAKSREIRVVLEFKNGTATVTAAAARQLGFSSGAPPQVLEYALRSKSQWRELAINVPRHTSEEFGDCDVAALLFWQYTGRRLPGSNGTSAAFGATGHAGGDAQVDNEEEELTRSLHQGGLDLFVLQWRLNIHRIKACSGKNRDLLKQRIGAARRLVDTEAEDRPELWSKERREFVEGLFGTALRSA